jgi:hypothetical protein
MPRKKEQSETVEEWFPPEDFVVEETEPEAAKGGASVMLLMLLCCILPVGGFLAGAQYVSVTDTKNQQIAELEASLAASEEKNMVLERQLQVTQSELAAVVPPAGPRCSQAQDPTIYFSESDIRCNETGLVGLDLASYTLNNTETTATYQPLAADAGEAVSGTFELSHNETLDQLTLLFYPDEQSAAALQGDGFLTVVPTGEAVLNLLPEDGCPSDCQDALVVDGETVSFTGSGTTRALQLVLHSIAADSIGSTIEFAELELTPEETDT